MKTIALMLAGAALWAAESQPAQTPPQKPKTLAEQRAEAAAARQRLVKQAAAQSAKKAAPTVSIPPDAVQVGPNLYRHTDADGKTWFYGRTPLGVSRWEDSPASKTSAPPPAAKQETPITKTDLGEKLQYERQTPFGSMKWTQKKTAADAGKSAPAAPKSSPQSQDKKAEQQ
ncbi:MAG TPA: hypothetical protein VMU80_23720 [Bryobacteraceae bacterium]|nr:hypothetical protein [Bryobacteraceae bacterium]HUO32245.1 hypothetical protein [Bryobacteraceae bacterium]